MSPESNFLAHKRQRIEDLRGAFNVYREELRSLVDAAEVERRELNGEESELFEGLAERAEEAKAEIALLEEQLFADEQHYETMRQYAPIASVVPTSYPVGW